MSDIRHAYNQWASSYDSDRNLTRDLDEQVTRALLAGRQPRLLLELGCGTGKNTPFYARIAENVLALDFSEAMLARARRQPLPAAVHFAIADLTSSLPCVGGAVDVAACNLVLEHIADLSAVFAEVARVLRPGGTFYVCELHPFKQYVGKKAVFERDGAQVQIPAYVHHVSDFVGAGEAAGFALAHLGEWWHAEDHGLPPRLISFLFTKPAR